MPKLYEYLGLVIFFYSNEHEPVYSPWKKPLSAAHKKNFKTLVRKLSDEIVQSWINYFIYNKKIVSKKMIDWNNDEKKSLDKIGEIPDGIQTGNHI